MDEERQFLLENDTNSISLSYRSENETIYGINTGSVRKQPPKSGPITYTWNNINVFGLSKCNNFFLSKNRSSETSGEKQILRNVCGTAYPGELLAILGPSGAGKTTLLNALTFRNTKDVTISGSRYINSLPANSKYLIDISAYVQQNDLFIDSLTVREHLIFQALVRIESHFNFEQRMKRVEDVLIELGLKKCESVTIGIYGIGKGISGGERKRLSLAAEILTNPSLMFCDEPTSGLDSFMALQVIQALRSMSQVGRTIICTIHQPSSELYSLFDKILLLAEGRVAFMGTPIEANLFFSELEVPCPKNYNPADYFMQLLAIIPEKEYSCRQAVTIICDQYEKSILGAKIILESDIELSTSNNDGIILKSTSTLDSCYKTSWLDQFCALLWRSWLSIMKNPNIVHVRIIQTLMVSFIIGAIYFHQILNENGISNINGVLFLFVTSMTFQNVFAVIHVFSAELPIFLRENRNGMYRTDAYFLSKTFAEIPIFIFLPLLFTSIAYYMIGLNEEIQKFLIACGIVTLVANVATSFGYLISCASNSVSMSLTLGSPLILPFLLFGGFFLNINSIPNYMIWLSYLSWFRYGNEALMINQWESITEINCTFENSTCLKNGTMILNIYNFSKDHLFGDIIGLISLIVGFRCMAFFILLRRTYS